MFIHIMDYSNGSITIINFDKKNYLDDNGVFDDELLLEELTNKGIYNESNCYYMTTDTITLKHINISEL